MSATLIGTVGVALLLVAFLLNLLKLQRASDTPYMTLNLVGAALACWSSVMIRFLPFVVLEGVWAAVAALALARQLSSAARGRRRPNATPGN